MLLKVLGKVVEGPTSTAELFDTVGSVPQRPHRPVGVIVRLEGVEGRLDGPELLVLISQLLLDLEKRPEKDHERNCEILVE